MKTKSLEVILCIVLKMVQKKKLFLRLYNFSWIKSSLFVQILMRFQNAKRSIFFIYTYQKLICIQIRLPQCGYILCLNFDTLILLNVCSQSLKALSVFEFRLLWWILNWVAVFIVAAKDKPLQCIFGVFFCKAI